MSFEKAWLEYRLKPELANHSFHIFVPIWDKIMENTKKELSMAIQGLTGKKPVEYSSIEELEGAEIEGTKIFFTKMKELTNESLYIHEKCGNIYIEASDSKGFMHGTFTFIRYLRIVTTYKELNVKQTPAMPLRMLNHWDNMDGSIERGYSGNSFFFNNNEIIVNERTTVYCRLLASIGINAVVINNVNVKNAATWLITDRYFSRLKELSEVFAGYGISLYLSLNYAAPVEMGELTTADPQCEEVRNWWKDKMQTVFHEIPNLGGFLIKADSEGRPGPFTYGRTHADGANMLAEAVKPYGGKIIWRCFVYNCKQDWRDKKTDRARSGYDNFMPLDGMFEDNVILQIKNGPMDFQVREPVHPLFGALEKTNQMLEVQIAQEYTGQQRHVCYLIPMFKEILEFRTYIPNKPDRVLDLISGKSLNQTNCGIAAVANTGDDDNWTGHDLAAANLYGFGRLAFDPSLSAEDIAKEWINLTYGNDKQIVKNLTYILMHSWQAYEKYTSPLGIGWMVNPSYHYGPNVDGYEYDRWGTYHRADHMGMGVDRSDKGTGYAMLYRKQNAEKYNNPVTCPEELLLFFHYIPYSYKLSTSKTMLQHIYDTHFEGVEMVDEMTELFEELKGKISEKSYLRTCERFHHQQEHARLWRDQINTYFYRKSGIPDEKGRTIF